MDIGLEKLRFSFNGTQSVSPFTPAVVGVVGSGNLEVMIESVPGDQCTIEIETSARGFDAVWKAVCEDFHAQHDLKGIRLSINDMGATPAVVSLRLQQAAAGVR